VSPRILAAQAAFLAASPAFADDNHYQDQIVGEDALGMGGAFTAVADDASAAFYNPAGLAQIKSGSLSGSLSVYGYERRVLHNGFQTSYGNAGDCSDSPSSASGRVCTRDFDHEDYPTRAIGGGVVKRFGKRGPDRQRPFAFAFSTYVPFQSSYTYRVAYRVDNPFPYYPEVVSSDRNLSISEEDKTIWVGPSLAYRVNADLSFGLSGFLSTRSLTRGYDESRVDGLAPGATTPEGAVTADYANIITTSLDMTALTLVFRFGALWTPGDRLRLGIMLAPPSLPVDASANLRNRSLLATVPPSYDRSSFHCPGPDESGLSPHCSGAGLPAHGRLGLAYVVNETMLVAADASIWLPLSYTDDSPLVTSFPLFTDNYFVRVFDRELTTNFNAGFESMLGEVVPFRFGVFTNLSSAPEPEAGAVAMQPAVDMYGVSTAVGFRDEGYDISVGAAFMRGIGHAQAYRPPDVNEDVPYSVERFEQTAVYFYLAGAKKAAGRAVRDFMKP
jgi:long-chain fatty acid transport protein